MSNRPLFSVLVLWPLLQVTPAAAESACKPNYQVAQTACRETDEILSYATVIDRGVVVNEGACKVPDTRALCREFVPRYQQKNPKAERIEFSNPTKDEINEACGISLKKVQRKVNVSCDFTYQLAKHRMVTDVNCPVEQIQDVNGCFAAAVPNLDPTAVGECLALKVTNKAELWIKAVCLHDISQAALNLDISPADYEQVQSKLAIIKRKIQGNPEFAKLNQILETK